VSEVFRNCPRYVHHYEKIPWKRVDDVQSFLSAKDRARVEREGGLISRAEYEKYINDVKDRESSDLLSSDERLD
jgi:uncharacterized protein